MKNLKRIILAFVFVTIALTSTAQINKTLKDNIRFSKYHYIDKNGVVEKEVSFFLFNINDKGDIILASESNTPMYLTRLTDYSKKENSVRFLVDSGGEVWIINVYTDHITFVSRDDMDISLTFYNWGYKKK